MKIALLFAIWIALLLIMGDVNAIRHKLGRIEALQTQRAK